MHVAQLVVELPQSSDRGGGRIEDVAKEKLPYSNDVGGGASLKDIKRE